MMSNSRASRAAPTARLGVGAVAVMLAAMAAAPAGAEPPFPAVAPPPVVSAQAYVESRAAPQRVRIVATRIAPSRETANRVRAILALADGADAGATIIAVEVAEPFRGLDRTASPVVLVDGRALASVILPENPSRVYALVPARLRRNAAAAIQVGWIGDLERTISEPVRAPLRRRR